MPTRPTTAFKLSVTETPLDPMPFKAEQILGGDPLASGLILWKPDDDEIRRNGLWECTPGISDYKQRPDEVTAFVFLSGDATITPEGGDPIEVGPGDALILPEGTTTVWDVRETIRVFFWVHE